MNDAELRRYFNCAAIDYRAAFSMLFVAFTRWLRSQTGQHTLRDGLIFFSQQPSVWSTLYKNDSRLKSAMTALYILTQLRPLQDSRDWPGMLRDEFDWQGIGWLWYRIRCVIVHGEFVTAATEVMVGYAYVTLHDFMVAVMNRQDPSIMVSFG